MSKLVYVVKALGGRWDDRWEANVKAFSSMELAVSFSAERKRMDEAWIEKAERIIEEFEGSSNRVIDIQSTMLDYVECWYRIDVLEME